MVELKVSRWDLSLYNSWKFLDYLFRYSIRGGKVMKYLLLASLLLVGCSRNDDDLELRYKEPRFCVNGFKYMRANKGYALYLTQDGKPVRCSMKDK